MDDKTFNDHTSAQEWINAVESDKARVRDTDIYPQLRAWASKAAPRKILEIGAGQGVCSDKLDLDGRSYIGLEPSPILLARAKQLYGAENKHFVLGSAYHLPFPDGTFDAAFSVAVWHLLSDLKKAAEELSRALKPNGHFFIITANPGAYSAWTDFYTDSKREGRRFEGRVQLEGKSVSHDVLYLHSLDEIKNSLQAAHLEVRESETFRTSDKAGGLKLYLQIQGQKIPRS